MVLTSVLKSSLLSICFLGISIPAFSQNINTPENFPDPNFRMVVERFMGMREFTVEEAAAKSGTMDYFSATSRGISIEDMTGIEYFTSLTELICGWDSVKIMDLSHNTALGFFVLIKP